MGVGSSSTKSYILPGILEYDLLFSRKLGGKSAPGGTVDPWRLLALLVLLALLALLVFCMMRWCTLNSTLNSDHTRV